MTTDLAGQTKPIKRGAPKYRLTFADAQKGGRRSRLVRPHAPIEWWGQTEDAQYRFSQDDWSYLEHRLLRHAIHLVHGGQHKQVHPVVVQAAIAHDKRWAKKDTATVSVSVPASIQQSIHLALKIGSTPDAHTPAKPAPVLE